MNESEDFAEVISEILIHIEGLEERLTRMNKRMELTIRRMVKAESQLTLLNKVDDEMKDFKREQLILNKKIVDYMNKNQSGHDKKK